MNNFAPIALFCFNRINTLTACVESLKLCPEIIHKDLIIFSDASRNNEEKNKVDEVRSYIRNITGFKSIRLILRDENLGVDYNIIHGIQEMVQEFESFIVLEDDLIVSCNFLSFMDAALTHFKDFDKVLTLSAYNYVRIPKNYIWDCYFAERTNPWGWATWSHKIKDVDWDLALTNNFLMNSDEKNAFNKWGSDRSRMLQRTLKGHIRAWDIRLDYYQFKKGFITAFSCFNLVINNGFNSQDATNTTGFNRFKVEFKYFNHLGWHFPDFFPSNPTIKFRFISRNSVFKRFLTLVLKKMKINN